MIRSLEKDSIDRLLIRFSIPATVSALVSIIHNITDRYFIGRTLGKNGIAAVSILFPLTIFISGIAFLLATGGGSLVGIKLGEKKREEALSAFGVTIFLGIVIGILYSLPVTIFSKGMISAFGGSEVTSKLAFNYNLVTAPFALFQIVFLILTTFVRIEGKPKLSMIYGIMSAGINIILDYVLIVIFKGGVLGAGIATSIASIFATILMYFHFKRSEILTFSWRKIRFKFSDTMKIIKIGYGTFVNQTLNAVINIVMNRELIKYGSGDLSIASLGIVAMGRTIVNLTNVGINQGRQAILSYNFGAKRYDRVVEVMKKSLLYSVGIAIIGTIFIFVRGDLLVNFFVTNDPELLELTVKNLKIHLIFMFGTSLYLMTSSYFQGIGKGHQTFFLALFRLLLLTLPLTLILPKFMGEFGVWFAFPISDLISGFVSYYFMHRELKKLV